MTKVISCTVLHYGLNYLEWALRSIRDEVDECWVLYAPEGSFGWQADFPCPEGESELRTAAERGAGDKLRWHPGHYRNEGEHRDKINGLTDYDYMMIVDADEIWEPGLTPDVIHHFEKHPEHKSVRIATPQYWRSFWRGMPNDGLYAEHGWRGAGHGVTGAYLESGKHLHHFGYAQNEAVIRYKQYTHGHRGEWRWDWYETRFLPNAQIDLHPVIKNFWNAEDIDPFALGLPDFMHDHPFANLRVIDP